MAVSIPVSKEEKQKKVFEASLEIICGSGLSSVTHSRVAKRAGVSRAWIYRYVGKSREELIDGAVHYFGQVLTLLNRDPATTTVEAWRAQQVERLKFNFTQYQVYRFILPVYFRFSGSSNVVGQRIEQVKSEFVRRSASEMQMVFQIEGRKAAEMALTVGTTKLGLLHWWHSQVVKDEELAGRIVGVYATMLEGLVRKLTESVSVPVPVSEGTSFN